MNSSRRDDHSGQGRPEGPDHRDHHEVPELAFGARRRELPRELERERLTRDDRGDHHDQERADAREVELVDHLPAVEGRGERGANDVDREEGELLDGLDRPPQPFHERGEQAHRRLAVSPAPRLQEPFGGFVPKTKSQMGELMPKRTSGVL